MTARNLRTARMCIALLGFAIECNIAHAGSIGLRVDAANPKWDSGAPLATNDLSRLYVRIYGARQGASKTLLDAKPWSSSVKFTRESVADGVHCYEAAYAYDRDGDGAPEIEGPHTAETCGTSAVVLNLTAPNGITMEAP